LGIDTRRIATATVFGVIIFVVRALLPPPLPDLLVVVEAFLVGLAYILVGKGGATYVELVNGLLATPVKITFAPFSLVLAVSYGVLVDVFCSVLKVKSGENVRRLRLILAMTISTSIIGLTAYYTTVFVVHFLPNEPTLAGTILVVGILSGAAGGYLSSRVWAKNLRARFQNHR
jgi:hypothetical protein